MKQIQYLITFNCEDENDGAEAASELESFAVNVANSYQLEVAVDLITRPTHADEHLLMLLAHRETPTGSVEGRQAAGYLRASGYDPVDHWGNALPYPVRAMPEGV